MPVGMCVVCQMVHSKAYHMCEEFYIQKGESKEVAQAKARPQAKHHAFRWEQVVGKPVT